MIKTWLSAVVLGLFLCSTGAAVTTAPYDQAINDTSTGTSTRRLSGDMEIYTSTRSNITSPTIQLSGPRGTISLVNGITASSITLNSLGILLTGANSHILSGSSITTTGGFFGNGGALTGIPSSASIVGVYARLDGATFTGASGITNQNFTATGANGNFIGSSSFTTTGSFFGAGDHLTGIVNAIAAGSLDTTKIGSGAIDTSKILYGAVVTNGIADSNITNAKLASGAYSNITGVGTQGQALNMNSHLINSVTDPVSAQDAATKNYVDMSAPSLDYKAPVRLATTEALAANVYTNGSSGVGAKLTGLAIGTLTIDGAPAVVADRVLIKDEVTTANNGIYTVTTNSALVVYVLTRATDHDQAVEMSSGILVAITSGTANIDETWLQTTAVTTVGTDAVSFVQTSGLGLVSVTAALTKSGNTIGVDSSSVVVKNAGLIRNSEVDASSVTKYNSSGFVPNPTIDASSVTKQGNSFNSASQLLKLDSSSQIAASMIPTGSIDTTKLGSGAVDTSKLSMAAVTTDAIANSAVTLVKTSGVAGLTGANALTGLLSITTGYLALGSGTPQGLATVEVIGVTSTTLLRVGNGLVGSPSIAFNTLPNSGFYSDSSGFLFSGAGTKRWTFTTGGAFSSGSTGGPALGTGATAAAPAYSFSGNLGTGLYAPTSQLYLGFASSTTLFMVAQSTGGNGGGTTSVTFPLGAGGVQGTTVTINGLDANGRSLSVGGAFSALNSSVTASAFFGAADAMSGVVNAIAAGSLDTTKIGSGAIDTSKILFGAVTTNALADGAVDTTKIGSGAVTISKINASGAASSTNFLRGDGSWATPSSGGDVVTTATQTFSGANTFKSSTTFGAQAAYGTSLSVTADYRGVVFGIPTPVAVSSFTAAASVTFTNLISSYSYEVRGNILWSATSETEMVFNSDATASRYHSGGSCHNSDNSYIGSYCSPAGTNPAYICLSLPQGSNNPLGGTASILYVSWSPRPSPQNAIMAISFDHTFFNYQPRSCAAHGGGIYSGVADPTTVKFLPSAGTMTGYLTLYAIVSPLAY